METLCAMVLQLGRKYKMFVPLVSKAITKHRITCARYELYTNKIFTVSFQITSLFQMLRFISFMHFAFVFLVILLSD